MKNASASPPPSGGYTPLSSVQAPAESSSGSSLADASGTKTPTSLPTSSSVLPESASSPVSSPSDKTTSETTTSLNSTTEAVVPSITSVISSAQSSAQTTPSTDPISTVTLPPVRLPGSTSATPYPSALPNSQAVKADVQDTTEKESSYATALASKVNGVDPLTLRPPVLKAKENTGQDSKNSPKQSKPPGKKSAPLKVIAGVVATLLVIVGGTVAGLYLQQQQQDTRQEAASEEVTNTEIIRTQAEWTDFNTQWKAFIADTNNGWEDYVAYSKSDGARYKCDAPIMKVADETLFGCDLNAIFVISDIETYISPQPLPPQSSKLNAALDMLITDSALLQEAGKQGDVYLTADFYNNPQKDTVKRYEQLRIIKPLFEGKYEKTVDFEAIAIYFHNQEEPAIGTQVAREAAQTKMNALYERLKSGEITMEEAGNEIKADKIIGDTSGVSLSQMDPVFRENAYFNVKKHKFFSRIFRDPVYDDELRSLGEGQMSTVRVCKDYQFTTEEMFAAQESGEQLDAPMIDSCLVIFKVNKISLGIDPNIQSSAESHIQSQYKENTEVLIE